MTGDGDIARPSLPSDHRECDAVLGRHALSDLTHAADAALGDFQFVSPERAGSQVTAAQFQPRISICCCIGAFSRCGSCLRLFAESVLLLLPRDLSGNRDGDVVSPARWKERA